MSSESLMDRVERPSVNTCDVCGWGGGRKGQNGCHDVPIRESVSVPKADDNSADYNLKRGISSSDVPRL